MFYRKPEQDSTLWFSPIDSVLFVTPSFLCKHPHLNHHVWTVGMYSQRLYQRLIHNIKIVTCLVFSQRKRGNIVLVSVNSCRPNITDSVVFVVHSRSSSCTCRCSASRQTRNWCSTRGTTWTTPSAPTCSSATNRKQWPAPASTSPPANWNCRCPKVRRGTRYSVPPNPKSGTFASGYWSYIIDQRYLGVLLTVL